MWPAQISACGLGILAVGVLVGLPHGAVDHLVPDWLAGRPGRVLRPGVLLGYAATALLALGALLAAPVASLLVLFVASAIHFGLGEVAFDDERSGRRGRPACGTSRRWWGWVGCPSPFPSRCGRTRPTGC